MPETPLSRRALLARGARAALAAVGLAGSLGGASACRQADRPERSLRAGLRELRRHFPELPFDDADALAYLRAYAEHVRPLSPEALESQDFRARFLLSTDLFRPEHPEGEPIRFVALYHPYVNPCVNPLASL